MLMLVLMLVLVLVLVKGTAVDIGVTKRNETNGFQSKLSQTKTKPITFHCCRLVWPGLCLVWFNGGTVEQGAGRGGASFVAGRDGLRGRLLAALLRARNGAVAIECREKGQLTQGRVLVGPKPRASYVGHVMIAGGGLYYYSYYELYDWYYNYYWCYYWC